jgi:hypothetical protein
LANSVTELEAKPNSIYSRMNPRGLFKETLKTAITNHQELILNESMCKDNIFDHVS